MSDEDLIVAYNQLVKELKSVILPEQDVDSLKKEFAKQINSTRRQSAVEDLSDLIDLLQKRMALDYANVAALAKIVGAINDTEMNLKANRYFKQLYRRNLGPLTYDEFKITDYGLEKVQTLNSRVATVISNQIGDEWKQFCRALGLTEPEINDIDNSCSRLKDKVEKSLLLFTSRSDLFKRRHCLLQALSFIRRADIRLMVEEYFLAS